MNKSFYLQGAIVLALAATFSEMLAGSPLNREVFRSLQQLAEPLPDWLLSNLTFMGDTVVALVLLLLVARYRPQLMWAAVIAAILAALASRGFKLYFDAPRPPSLLGADALRLVGKAYHSGSFPSGHTTTIFVLAGILAACANRVGTVVALILLATLTGLSRVFIGAHWPVDVAAGAFLGYGSAMLGVFISDLLRPPTVAVLFQATVVALMALSLYLMLWHRSDYEYVGLLAIVVGYSGLMLGAQTLLEPLPNAANPDRR